MSALSLRVVSVIGVFLALLTTLTALCSWIDGRGYARAVNEFQVEYANKLDASTKEAIAKAEAEISEALKQNKILYDAELMRVSEERVVETKIIKVVENVDKIKYIDNCGMLHDDSIKLLNNSINIANRTDTD